MELAFTLQTLLNIFCLLWLLPCNKAAMANDVPQFTCGNDMCTANERYCDHHDSGDPQTWTCTPCEEEKSRCPTLNVNPHCFGYCQKLETDRKLREYQVKLESQEKRIRELEVKGNESQTNIMLQWKSSNETYESRLTNANTTLNRQQSVITALIITIVVGIALLSSITAFCWLCRYKSKGIVGSVSSLTKSDTNSAEDGNLKQVLIKENAHEEQELCEGTRRTRAMMTNQNPADHDGPSRLDT